MENDYIALLIDGDNISYKYVPDIIEKSKKFGKVLISRVYGDFSEPEHKNWKSPSIKFNIEPIIVWRLSGKNSSDLRLTADAVEICNQCPKINKFVIVSGDKDYTTLISKLKIQGKYIIGISANNISTSYILRNCCDEFLILEQELPSQDKKNKNYNYKELKDSLLTIFEDSEEELIHLGLLKEKLLQKDSSFTEINFGYNTFGKLMNNLKDIIEVKKIKNQKYACLV